MKSIPNWLTGIGFIIALAAIGFPPFKETWISNSTGKQGAIFEIGHRFVLNKPEPSPALSGFHGIVQIDTEKYFSTIAFGIALCAVSIFFSFQLKKNLEIKTNSREGAEILESPQTISYIGALNRISENLDSAEVPFAWQRFFAKLIDIAIARAALELIGAFIYIQFGWAPPYQSSPIIAYTGTATVLVLLVILIEATMLAQFHTTIGKKIFGISLRRKDGHKPVWRETFFRTLYSYTSGTWLLIGAPILTLPAAYLSFMKLRDTKAESPWDITAETTLWFRRIGILRLCFGVALGIFSFMSLLVIRDITTKAFRKDSVNMILR